MLCIICIVDCLSFLNVVVSIHTHTPLVWVLHLLYVPLSRVIRSTLLVLSCYHTGKEHSNLLNCVTSKSTRSLDAAASRLAPLQNQSLRRLQPLHLLHLLHLLLCLTRTGLPTSA